VLKGRRTRKIHNRITVQYSANSAVEETFPNGCMDGFKERAMDAFWTAIDFKESRLRWRSTSVSGTTVRISILELACDMSMTHGMKRHKNDSKAQWKAFTPKELQSN
jgi:hypothetical protein